MEIFFVMQYLIEIYEKVARNSTWSSNERHHGFQETSLTKGQSCPWFQQRLIARLNSTKAFYFNNHSFFYGLYIIDRSIYYYGMAPSFFACFVHARASLQSLLGLDSGVLLVLVIWAILGV